MTCANNCKGVNPNAVIIGGTAVLAASTVTLQQVLTIGAGVAAAGGGAAVVGQMVNQGCPRTRPCRVSPYFLSFLDIILIFPIMFKAVIPRDQVGETPGAEFAVDSLGRPVAGLSVQGVVE